MWQQGYAENLNESTAQKTPFTTVTESPKEQTWMQNATGNVLEGLKVVRDVGKTYIDLKNGGTSKPAGAPNGGLIANPNPGPFDYLGKLFVKPAQSNDGVSSEVGHSTGINPLYLVVGAVVLILLFTLRR